MALGAPPSLTEVPGGSSTATPLLCAEPVPSGHSGGACPERGAAAGKFEATIVGSFFTEICDDSHTSWQLRVPIMPFSCPDFACDMPEAPRVILPQLLQCQPYNPSLLTHLGPETLASFCPLELQGRNWASVLRLSSKHSNLHQPLGQVPQQLWGGRGQPGLREQRAPYPDSLHP